jgi:hypothetical protein
MQDRFSGKSAALKLESREVAASLEDSLLAKTTLDDALAPRMRTENLGILMRLPCGQAFPGG